MEKIMNWEQWRIIAISTVSPLFDPDKGFCLCVSSNVCVQYLGGNEGGRRGDCPMQKLFVP